MNEGENNRQLHEENEQLRREIELLKAKIIELEARLAQYDNAHTPPSLKRGRNRKKDQDKNDKGKSGQKIGHKGVTRPYTTPDRQVQVTMDRCPDCGADLGIPFKIDSKIIEEIPEPQPVIVTEYKIGHYRCPCCRKEVVASDCGCPHDGKFGNNVIAQATLLKYEYRLTHRKIKDAMMRLFGLKISPATILDLTRRAADAVQSEYDAILNKIRGALILYVDETSIRVQGERHWIWTFSTPFESFFVIRKSRGMKVLTEVLTRRFKGIIVCDGWKPYARFTKHLQRCWAHLLRESKEIAEKFEAAAGLVAAYAGLRHRGKSRPMRLRGSWLRLVLLPTAAVAGDAARVGVHLLRAVLVPGSHMAGTISRQPFRPGNAGPADAGRRALVTLASSFAPNGFVLDVAPSMLLREGQALLMHRLAPARPDPDRE